MKKGLKLNKSIFVICLLIISISCSSHYTKEDVTKTILDSFTAFASESDTVAIKKITLRFTDKRFYAKFEHAALGITYDIGISNRSSDTLKINIIDTATYAFYKQNKVGWLSDWHIDDFNNIQIAPSQSQTIYISNTGFFGGAFFEWENLFPKKDDYTHDIMRILPKIKVYYNGQIVLPEKDIKILVINYRDEWYYRTIHRLLGSPYSFDTPQR